MVSGGRGHGGDRGDVGGHGCGGDRGDVGGRDDCGG